MINKLHLKESTDVNTYKDTMDGLTLTYSDIYQDLEIR